MVVVAIGYPDRFGSGGDGRYHRREERDEHKAVADCSSGAFAADYRCCQQRYKNLVRNPGVEAAFAELKDEYANNDVLSSYCHQLTHVIGRTAAELYGDLPTTYSHGDSLCWSGYYHGALETFVARIGPDKNVFGKGEG